MIRGLVTVFLWMITGVGPAVSQTLITSAANVRLRSAPGTDAAVVSMLPLGTELSLSSPEGGDGWVQVRTLREEVQQGWIDGSLTLPVSDVTYPEVVNGLIEARLAREGDGFGAQVELLDLVESVLKRDLNPEGAAGLELQRLRALRKVLLTIPWNRSLWSESLRAWVVGRSGEIRYNEPGGHWLLQHDPVIALHDRFRSTAAADEIAWFAVTNGLGGECEGHLVCYMERTDKIEGEYLRRQPAGRHVEEAAARVRWVAEDHWTAVGPARYYFDAQRECGALETVIASLESAVRNSRIVDRTELAGKLRESLTLCSDPAATRTFQPRL